MTKRQGNFKTTVEQEKEILEQYQDGASIKFLMDKFSVGRKAIRGALQRHGLILDKKHHQLRQRAFTPEQEKNIIYSYRTGMSCEQIRICYGVKSVHSIMNVLTRHHIPRRKNRKYQCNEHAFDNINDELTHYWLGFIYADGTVNHNALRIGLAPKDKIQIVKVRDFMNGDQPIRQTDICVSVDFHHIHLAEQLSIKGIIARRGRFDLTLPHIQDKHKHHFIRGYLDGDGCISVTEQIIFLGQVDILNWIRDTLHKECQTNLTKIRPRQGIHEISWGGINQARQIVNYLYQDSVIWLERKRLVAENWRCGE